MAASTSDCGTIASSLRQPMLESSQAFGCSRRLLLPAGVSGSLAAISRLDLYSSSNFCSLGRRKHRHLARCHQNGGIFCQASGEKKAIDDGDFSHLSQAWEVLRHDVQYLDWRARQDILAIKVAHDKVVEVLNPLARETKSINTLKKELAHLQEELQGAHEQVHLSEARVNHTLSKLAEMETLVHDELLQKESNSKVRRRTKPKGLNVSGPPKPYPASMKDNWFPVAFSTCVNSEEPLAIEIFEQNWVLFRGKDGRAGCVHDACAHRACPLSLGKVNDGCLQCPYHGWEYSTNGACLKMPSTKFVPTRVKSLPCIEKEGLVWIWPGLGIPSSEISSLLPPENFTVHAELVIELDVEHGLLMENLLDLAHAPFTHTTTFARGWSVPSSVRFKTPAETLRGYWDPYPIDMEFRQPCMVLSTIGLAKPGKLDGNDTKSCKNHLHQLHVCIPSGRHKTRLLYRMSLDFAPWLKHVPFIQYLWMHLAKKVLGEDLRLVAGQQDRMHRGCNVWNLPVPYDKLGLRYRNWRLSCELGSDDDSQDK